MDNHFYQHLLDNFLDGVFFVDRDRTITLWNHGMETISGFPKHEVEGKTCSEDLIRHVDHQGRSLCRDHCPLDQTIADGKERISELFLRHRDGHLVPVSTRTIPIFDTKGEVIGAAQTIRDNSQKLSTLERIQEMEKAALLDPLTQLGTRKYTEMTLAARMELLERYGWPFGVLFISVDRFDDVTVTHGLEAGNEILRMVGRTLASNLRPFDFIGRWDRFHFLVIIENVDDDRLSMIGNKLRILIEQSGFPLESGRISITVSIGARRARRRDSAGSIAEEAERWFSRRRPEANTVELIKGSTPG